MQDESLAHFSQHIPSTSVRSFDTLCSGNVYNEQQKQHEA